MKNNGIVPHAMVTIRTRTPRAAGAGITAIRVGGGAGGFVTGGGGGGGAITVSFSGGQGIVGVPYQGTFTATGGTAPYTWALASTSPGLLPAGLTLDPNSGVLSGTPTTPGGNTFIVQATDSAGATGSLTVSIVIIAAGFGVTSVHAGQNGDTNLANGIIVWPNTGDVWVANVQDISPTASPIFNNLTYSGVVQAASLKFTVDQNGYLGCQDVYTNGLQVSNTFAVDEAGNVTFWGLLQTGNADFSVNQNGVVGCQEVDTNKLIVGSHFFVDQSGNVTFDGLLQNGNASFKVDQNGVVGCQELDTNKLNLYGDFSCVNITFSGVLQDLNSSFTVDQNGNIGCQTVHSNGLYVSNTFSVDEAGDVTFLGLLQNGLASFKVDQNGVVGCQEVDTNKLIVGYHFFVDQSGDVTFDGLLQNGNASFAVDQNGVVGCQELDTNVLRVNHDFYVYNLTFSGALQNANASFAVDQNGNVGCQVVNSNGLNVSNTFSVDRAGDVTFLGLLQNGNASFKVDQNGVVGCQELDTNKLNLYGDFSCVNITYSGVLQTASMYFRVAQDGHVGCQELDTNAIKVSNTFAVDWAGNVTFLGLLQADQGSFTVNQAGNVGCQELDLNTLRCNHDAYVNGNLTIGGTFSAHDLATATDGAVYAGAYVVQYGQPAGGRVAIDGSQNIYGNQFISQWNSGGPVVTIDGNRNINCNQIAAGGANFGSGSDGIVASMAVGGQWSQFRAVWGNYGVIFRNDGGSFYLLKTNPGDPYGIWDGTRPFTIDLGSGNVYMSQSLTVGGDMYISGTFGAYNLATATTGGVYAGAYVVQNGQPAGGHVVIDGSANIWANSYFAAWWNGSTPVIDGTGHINCASVSIMGQGVAIGGSGRDFYGWTYNSLAFGQVINTNGTWVGNDVYMPNGTVWCATLNCGGSITLNGNLTASYGSISAAGNLSAGNNVNAGWSLTVGGGGASISGACYFYSTLNVSSDISTNGRVNCTSMNIENGQIYNCYALNTQYVNFSGMGANGYGAYVTATNFGIYAVGYGWPGQNAGAATIYYMDWWGNHCYINVQGGIILSAGLA